MSLHAFDLKANLRSYPDIQNDPDLFYALRGGGGGVWGVVSKQAYVIYTLRDGLRNVRLTEVFHNRAAEVTYEVHPQTQIQHFSMYLSSAPIAGLLNQDSILQDFIKQLGKYAQPWADASGAGYTFIYPGTLGQLTNYTVVSTSNLDISWTVAIRS